MALADRIKELRMKRKWTQQNLADAAGLTRTSVYYYEQGREPGIDAACKLASALGVPVSYLVAGDPNQEETAENERFEIALEAINPLCHEYDYSRWADESRITITLEDTKVHTTCEDLVDLVESVYAEAEKRKQAYIRRQLTAKLYDLPEYIDPEENPEFEKY